MAGLPSTSLPDCFWVYHVYAMYIPEYAGNQIFYTGWRFANWWPTVLLFDAHSAGENKKQIWAIIINLGFYTQTSGLPASWKSEDLIMLAHIPPASNLVNSFFWHAFPICYSPCHCHWLIHSVKWYRYRRHLYYLFIWFLYTWVCDPWCKARLDYVKLLKCLSSFFVDFLFCANGVLNIVIDYLQLGLRKEPWLYFCSSKSCFALFLSFCLRAQMNL